MSAVFTDEALRLLESRLETGGPVAIMEEADRQPDRVELQVVAGCLLIRAGRPQTGCRLLWRAVITTTTRARALAVLAAFETPERLDEVGARLDLIAEQSPMVCHARGLVHWRLGRHGRAISVWTGGGGDPSLYHGARRLYAAESLAAGRHGEALLALPAPAGDRDGVALDAMACAASRHQAHLVAAAAARKARQTPLWPLLDEPSARALAVERCLGHPREQVRARAALARAAMEADQGDLEAAAATLDGQTGPYVAEARALLEHARTGAPVAADACNWHRLRELVGDDRELMRALDPEPLGSLQMRLADRLAKGDYEAAHALLAAEFIEKPGDDGLLRALAAISWERARRRPHDTAAWLDMAAMWAARTSDRDGIKHWIRERLAVYDSPDEDIDTLADQLRAELHGRVDRAVDARAAMIHQATAPPASSEPDEVRVAWIREHLAAEAMNSIDVGSAPLERLRAMGPLFAARAGLGDAVAAIFTDGRGRDRARVFFSELGDAAALLELQALDCARDRALEVMVRWTPPFDVVAFAALNPGYAALVDGPRRLCADAAKLLEDIGSLVLRKILTRPRLDADAIRSHVRTMVTEAVALGDRSRCQRAIAEVFCGRCRALADRVESATLADAVDLIQLAHALELPGLASTRGYVLFRHGHSLGLRRLFRRAVDCLRDAVEAEPGEAAYAQELSILLLRRYEQLRSDGRAADAAVILDEARGLARSCALRFPHNTQLAQVGTAIEMVRAGVPLDELLSGGSKPEAPRDIPPVPDGARPHLAACRQRREGGDLAAASAEIEAARAFAPDHPTVVLLAAEILLDQARECIEGADQPGDASAPGADLFDRAEMLMTPVEARNPAHAGVRSLRARLNRARVLHHPGGTLGRLHRKGVLLLDAGRCREAADVMKTVFALGGRDQSEACASLAEALLALAAEGQREHLGTAEKVLALARELGADHEGIHALRRRADRIKADEA